ncbi:MAG TPA: sigma-70 family RNA polymerase sigma factor [Enhygromyxa sp.]|nr:sigma-70 family RNA polymerase sigma factor [Enhygromyxa sp.]
MSSELVQHFIVGRHAVVMMNGPTMSIEELDWLRTLATRLAAGGDEDDLVQETVLAAWKSNPEVAHDRPLRPWLGAVARNRARMNARARSRREQREHAAAEVITPSAAQRPDDELARVRALQAVCAALDELPELDRRIIIRRFVDEENATQIGERLGIPAATVRSRLRRSLAQLRSTLDARHGGWALALVGPMPRGKATASSVGFGAKLGLTLTIGVGAAVVWSSCNREDERGEDQPAVAAEQAATETSKPPPELSERERWEQRRAQIRAALTERSASEGEGAVPSDDAATEWTAEAIEQARRDTVARARAGFGDLKRACMEDLGRDASGAITISAVVIGDPQVGTIFDSVEIVAETVGDPEVIACVREAMYAYVGEPPPVPVESPFVRTMPWVGRMDDDDRKERRVFDAIVGAHHSEIAFCQRGEAFVGPGTALIEFTVEEDKLAEPRVLETDLPAEVVDCIVTASLRWTFPKLMDDKMFWYEFKLPVEGLDRVFEK